MAIIKETRSYNELTNQYLLTSSRLNLYNILSDNISNIYFNNIFKNITISNAVKENNDYFLIHIATNDDWWDNISDEYYETPNLWYLLCTMNDVINPYEELTTGQQVKVLKQEYIYNIFKDIKRISEL